MKHFTNIPELLDLEHLLPYMSAQESAAYKSSIKSGERLTYSSDRLSELEAIYTQRSGGYYAE